MPKLCPRPNCRRGGRRERADSVPLGHTRPLLFTGCCRGDMAGGDGAEGGVTAEPDGGRSPEHQPPHTNPTSSTSRFAAPPPACCPSVPCPAPRLSQGFGLAGAQHQRSAPVSVPGATAGCSHKATGTQQSAGQGAVPPAEPPAPPSWVLPQPAVLPWGLQHPCVPAVRGRRSGCVRTAPLCVRSGQVVPCSPGACCSTGRGWEQGPRRPWLAQNTEVRFQQGLFAWLFHVLSHFSRCSISQALSCHKCGRCAPQKTFSSLHESMPGTCAETQTPSLSPSHLSRGSWGASWVGSLHRVRQQGRAQLCFVPAKEAPRSPAPCSPSGQSPQQQRLQHPAVPNPSSSSCQTHGRSAPLSFPFATS